MWSLQEQVLATQCEVYHGRQSISISSLLSGQLKETIAFLTKGDGRPIHDARHGINLFCRAYDHMQRSSRDGDSLQLVKMKSFFAALLLEVAFLLECKRPLDKIYGIYTILTVYCDVPLSAPDYDKTAEEVYEETVWSWINSRGDLNILKLAARPKLDLELPSWVPAWHRTHPRAIRNTGESLERYQIFRRGAFNWNYSKGDLLASDTSSGVSRESEDTSVVASLISPGKLCVFQARFAGMVSQALGPNRSNDIEWYKESFEALYVHLEWCGLVRDVFFHGHTKSEEVHALRELFRSILEPGLHQFEPDPDGKSEELFESFRAWFHFILYLQDATETPGSVVSGETDADDRDLAIRFYFNVWTAEHEEEALEQLESGYCGDVQGRENLTLLAKHIRVITADMALVRNHTLCILDNDNMIAVTDYWCQEGDEVFVFPGTDSPFVLRREPDGDCYRLLGPAVVDRLLRVGYQEWRSEGDDLQDIVLI